MPPTSLRSIAKACGVSISTVSRALAGKSNVEPDTRHRIEVAAARAGYRRNNLVGELMGLVRKARTTHLIGTIAVVHVPSKGQPRLLPTQQRIIRGAAAQAQRFVFKLDCFTFGADGLSALRLADILEARGILGAIFIYADPTAQAGDFPWSRFCCIEIDFGRPEPILNTVCIDHYLTFFNALVRLRTQGYRRIGLFLESFKDKRITYRWSAAFRSTLAIDPKLDSLPILISERMTEKEFLGWYFAHKPDLVIGHVDKAVDWLAGARVAVPKKTAFFNLNWTARTRPCAGLDLRPELQGEVAAETLISQIMRNEKGPARDVRTIMVEGKWQDGPTLGKHSKDLRRTLDV